MAKILVTGGFGFIGGHLVHRLLCEGHHVHVVDDLSTSPIPLEVLMKELPLEISSLSHHIMTIEDYYKANKEHVAFDQIYHLASPVGPAGILKWAGIMARRILDDAHMVMDMAQRCGARLVDVSTSEIYGGGQGGLCAETMPRIVQAETTVRLEYAVGKLAAETAMINTAGLNLSIVRPFNVSGPRQSGKGGFVLPRFVAQAMSGQPLTVFGDGKQIRAFTHVADIVDGIVRVMERGKSGEAYNIGNPDNRITIVELAERVQRIVGETGINYTDGKAVFGATWAEASDKYPDASKAMRELKWSPLYSVNKTIVDVHEYMKSATPEGFERLAGFTSTPIALEKTPVL